MTTHSVPRHSRVIDRTPFFYGWIILAAGTVSTIMIGPSQSFTVGLFVDKFVAELGVTRSSLALIFGISTLSATLLLPIMGRLTDRFGSATHGRGLRAGSGRWRVLMGWLTGLATIFFGLMLLRFFGFGSLQLASNHVIAQWFVERRGTVMGIAGQSLAIGLLIFPVLGEFFIGHYGWRGAWNALGVLVALIVIPIGWGLFRDRPELYGKVPDGESRHEESDLSRVRRT